MTLAATGQMGIPNFLAYADDAVPRSGEMTIAGTKAGLSLQQTLADIEHMKQIRPLELGVARVKAEQMQLSLDRFKTLNSMEILDAQAKRVLFEEQARLDDLNERLRTSTVTRDYEKWITPKVTGLMIAKDWRGIANVLTEASERYGEDLWRTQGSKMGAVNILSTFNEQEQAEIQDAMRRMKASKEIQAFELIDEQRQLAKDVLTFDKKKKETVEDLKDFGGVLPKNMGISYRDRKGFLGRKWVQAKNARTRNRGLRKHLDDTISLLEQDPALAENNPEYIEAMKLLRGYYDGPRSGQKDDPILQTRTPAKAGLFGSSDHIDIAVNAYRTIHKLSQAIGGPDKEISKQAQDGLRKYMYSLRAPSEAVRLSESFTTEEDALRRRASELDVRRTSLAAPATKRSVIEHISTRRGGSSAGAKPPPNLSEADIINRIIENERARGNTVSEKEARAHARSQGWIK